MYFFYNFSHLSAHDHMLESRIQEYNTIIDSHTYKSEVINSFMLKGVRSLSENVLKSKYDNSIYQININFHIDDKKHPLS